ncbi:MAG: hypothetical protein KBC16_03220 [Candidatus Pacebacteria bacterium]|nr:hypothetical protein [Candidatus Paceibacterota bacterium]
MSDMVSPSELRSHFFERKLHGVVALIDFLEEERLKGNVVKEIASTTVSFHKPITECTGPELMALPTIVIGSRRGSPTPLEALAEFSNGDSSPEALRLFDLLCKDLAERDNSKFTVIASKSIIFGPPEKLN